MSKFSVVEEQTNERDKHKHFKNKKQVDMNCNLHVFEIANSKIKDNKDLINKTT